MKPCSEFKTTKDFLQQSAFKKPIKKTKEPEEYIKKHRWHKHTFDCGQCGMQILDCEVCNVLYCPGLWWKKYMQVVKLLFTCINVRERISNISKET